MNSHNDKQLYLLGKMLETLPGKNEDIRKDLEAMRDNKRLAVSPERLSHFRHVKQYLDDWHLGELTREAIVRRIAALTFSNWGRLPKDIQRKIISYGKLKPAKLVSTFWKTTIEAPSLWRERLCDDFGFSRWLVVQFQRPDVVYHRYSTLSAVSKKRMGIFPRTDRFELALHCLDKKTKERYHAYFYLFNDVEAILSSGNLELLQYKLSSDPTFHLLLKTNLLTDDGYMFVLGSGSLSSFKFLQRMFPRDLIKNVPEEKHYPYFSSAFKSGSLPLVRYLDEIKQIKSGLLYDAASSGSTPLVKYLVEEKKYELATHRLFNTLTYAAHSGSLSLVRYLVEEKQMLIKSKEVEKCIMTRAIHSGSLPVVLYLEEQGVPLNTLDLLLVLRQAETISIEIVTYLIKKGLLKADQHLLDLAVSRGLSELIDYIAKRTLETVAVVLDQLKNANRSRVSGP